MINPINENLKLFAPIQPTIPVVDNQVTYNETAPDNSLCNYIGCYWQVKNTTPLQFPFDYNVVADACIDFFFDLNDLSQSYVNGFSSTSSLFRLGNNFNYISIRFRPGAFSSIYGLAASELKNQCYPLDLVLKETFTSLTQLLENEQDISRIKLVFDKYFLSKISSLKIKEDPRFQRALQTIYSSPTILNIETELADCISARQLRRIFQFYTGVAPMTFSKVVRFQKYLRLMSQNDFHWNKKLYFDLGYYDQSHFIKDFRTMYGESPLKASIQ